MDYPVFRGGEVLNMAIRIEQQGVKFYEACASWTEQESVAEVFRRLMEQEKLHAQVFSRMKEAFKDYPLPESYPGEMRSYIDSFVSDQVFYDTEQAVDETSRMNNPFKAIEFGIQFEQRSILFYSAIKDIIRKSETKVVDEVIEQEHRHIRWLLGLRGKLEESELKRG